MSGVAAPARGQVEVNTVGKAATTYTRSMLSWQQHLVGLLNEQLLLQTFNRNLG